MPREAEFAVRYGVSRQAVREALKVLAAKGLISSRRRAGTRVLPRSQWNLLDPDVLAWHPPGSIAPEFLGDLIELRRLIEPAAAAFAARRAGPERLTRMKTALEGMRANTEDVAGFYDFDTEFHAALFAASGNSLIDRLSEVIGAVLRTSFDIQSKTRPSYRHAVAQHDTLYAAIAKGDAGQARRAMEDILAVASGEVEQVVRRARDQEGP